ncbi:winged helix-turn-helix domain-containing protein [Sphingomonas sp. DG1-23]|uniref:winged helix-turn-helix domain-containing protein n=1 Tax=Sphingomonas sp. DG1-23 TaxID=3068316 RepID=UPI00273DE737|nr:winged helix-turn-helix domain-containing protein [Sphingomonas sp. DG1-23]MDP5279475.1 winged helix-turn-helix domain-containing protein [Sphingomonas sp. DG1-23]
MKDTLSAAEARRIALGAQGFGKARPRAAIGPAHLARTIARVQLHQIDSVNVLARAHYLPLFSRLGVYPRDLLDKLAWGKPRHLFEYWAHEASLLPFELHPLLRWRMARAERGETIWGGLRRWAGEQRGEAEALLARIAAEGPLAASDIAETRGEGGWWGWSDTKSALEWLFWAGRITTATRRGSFERVYDLPERVLPAAVLAQPTPDDADAHRALLARAGAALGIATAGDLRDYFRQKPDDAHPRIAELVEAGTLVPVRVRGWGPQAYLHKDASVPRRVTGQALLAPFDPLIWERSRAERLFGIRYRIEIYTPAEKRVHGYYVLPFLLDGRIVARVDLKADRKAGRLLVQGAHGEPGAPDEAVPRLKEELDLMAQWLELDVVEVAGGGSMAQALNELATP